MDSKYAKKILDKVVLDYNSIADKYSRVREKDWREFNFLFDKYLSPNDKVLDLGCGNARFYQSFKNKNVDYLGIDVSSKLIEIAKNNHPEGKFEVSSVESILSDSFDKVYSIAVLHHIPSREFRLNFLKEIKRVLKGNGYLVLTVWNLKEKMKKRSFFDWFRLDKGDVFLPWYGSRDTYFHCFNLEELIQLVSEAGFDIIDKGEILVGERPYSNFYIVGRKNK
ncbi:MAG: methyltransferase domain-containing protein [Candidatus Paceibacterota bacterium]|jgi:ubiquinone/menaquinone biosynthesis C-methylase UbiE